MNDDSTNNRTNNRYVITTGDSTAAYGGIDPGLLNASGMNTSIATATAYDTRFSNLVYRDQAMRKQFTNFETFILFLRSLRSGDFIYMDNFTHGGRGIFERAKFLYGVKSARLYIVPLTQDSAEKTEVVKMEDIGGSIRVENSHATGTFKHTLPKEQDGEQSDEMAKLKAQLLAQYQAMQQQNNKKWSRKGFEKGNSHEATLDSIGNTIVTGLNNLDNNLNNSLTNKKKGA